MTIFNTVCIIKQDIKPFMNINDLYQNIFICLSISECTLFNIIFHIINKIKLINTDYINVSSLVTKDKKKRLQWYIPSKQMFPYSAYIFQYINRALLSNFGVCVDMFAVSLLYDGIFHKHSSVISNSYLILIFRVFYFAYLL